MRKDNIWKLYFKPWLPHHVISFPCIHSERGKRMIQLSFSLPTLSRLRFYVSLEVEHFSVLGKDDANCPLYGGYFSLCFVPMPSGICLFGRV